MDNIQQDRAKGLMLRGFSKNEVAKLMDVPLEELDNISLDGNMEDNSQLLYSDLQKDLAKLVLKEMQKENADGNLILNAIKEQSNLQEKKLMLAKNGSSEPAKANYAYVEDKDIRVENLKKAGMQDVDIAFKLKMSVAAVSQALDRRALNLPPELAQVLTASVITETAGLDRDTRIKILKDAVTNNHSKRKVRDIVNQVKNETR